MPVKSVNAHRGFVKRLDLVDELDEHTGCVNTINWNESVCMCVSLPACNYWNSVYAAAFLNLHFVEVNILTRPTGGLKHVN